MYWNFVIPLVLLTQLGKAKQLSATSRHCSLFHATPNFNCFQFLNSAVQFVYLLFVQTTLYFLNHIQPVTFLARWIICEMFLTLGIDSLIIGIISTYILCVCFEIFHYLWTTHSLSSLCSELLVVLFYKYMQHFLSDS